MFRWARNEKNKKMLRAYLENKKGQFALIGAIAAVPIALAVSIAMDTAMASRSHAHLQTALDSAALAAVVPGNLSNQQREDYAKEVFKENFKAHAGIRELEADASGPWVQISATYDSAPLMEGFLGQSTISVDRTSTALRESEDVICVMTLSEDQEGSLTIERDALINAPGCSIQVNSTNTKALKSSGSYIPNAKSICVAGGIEGSFASNLKANCTPQADPYAHLDIPVPTDADCTYGPIRPNIFPPRIDKLAESIIVGVDTVLKPGVYCHGLLIHDANVKLSPGVYYIHDGPLTVGENAIVRGEDVTFVFTGDSSHIYTYENFILDIKAPKTGPYAGLIFAQERNSSSDEISIIKGSANINLHGTTYLPTQDLFIGGTGVLGNSSKTMAFMAENMTLTSDIEAVVNESESRLNFYIFAIKLVAGAATDYKGNYNVGRIPNRNPLASRFTTNVMTTYSSHLEEGLPAVLPRSDGGARLVSNDLSPPSTRDQATR